MKNKKVKETIDKLRQTISHPSASALIYGYLKEKDINLKDMSVNEWKDIEKDLVEIILAEVYPGEEVTEDQLNFTTLAHSIAFMSNFIEALNKNLDAAGLSGISQDEEDDKEISEKSKFEI